jgi:hypothetical protein
MFGRVLNREFMNPRVRCKRDSLYKTFLSSLNRSEGFRRALRGNKSLIVRVNVNGYRSIFNASDAGKETETFFNSLNKSEGFQRALYKDESLIVLLS